LLSTASAISTGKRTDALTAWAQCLKELYGVNPVFAHVDKDMAEISMLRQVWHPKIQLCWWHLRKATRERLSKNKLTTTPYNVKRACLEAPFIDPKFIPIGSADANEYEGLPPDTMDTAEEPYISANSIKV
jgi:hypothetical protein